MAGEGAAGRRDGLFSETDFRPLGRVSATVWRFPRSLLSPDRVQRGATGMFRRHGGFRDGCRLLSSLRHAGRFSAASRGYGGYMPVPEASFGEALPGSRRAGPGRPGHAAGEGNDVFRRHGVFQNAPPWRARGGSRCLSQTVFPAERTGLFGRLFCGRSGGLRRVRPPAERGRSVVQAEKGAACLRRAGAEGIFFVVSQRFFAFFSCIITRAGARGENLKRFFISLR